MTTINEFNEALKQMLPFEKVKEDFFAYLDWSVEVAKPLPDEYVFLLVEEESGVEPVVMKEINLSRNTDLTLLTYRWVNDIYGVCYAPFTVTHALDKFVKPTKNDSCQIEKGLARLYYKYDGMELFNVEFYYIPLFQME